VITYVNTSNKGSLNLRAEPSKTSKVLTQIPCGTKLEVSSTTGEWCKVAYQQYIGYVMSQFLGSTDKQFTKADL
jgi:N-acetylmuramoyl-L-alanine amidase